MQKRESRFHQLSVRGRRLRSAVFVLLALSAMVLAGRVLRPLLSGVERPRAENVLLITLCTLRADRALAAGPAESVAPNLAALAGGGASFRSHYTQASYSGGSFATILTGLYPHHHGVYDHPMRLDDRLETLAERLRGAGFRTAGFVTHAYLVRRFGFDQGFDVFVDEREPGRREQEDAARVTAAVEWMRSIAGERFFVWVQLDNTHYAYGSAPASFVPPEAAKRFRRFLERMKDVPLGRLQFGFRRLGVTPEDVATIAEVYDAEVRYADHLVGRLVAVVDELGLRDSTLIAVAADHGDALGEHSLLVNHDSNLYDPTVRVPFVLNGAGVPRRSVDHVTRNVDLLPTVMEIADVEAGAPTDGVSLVPYLSGAAIDLPAFAETRPWVARRAGYRGYPLSVAGVGGKMRMIRRGRHKLIQVPRGDGMARELYDLGDDPGEQRNLAGGEPATAAALSEELERWFAAHEGAKVAPLELRREDVESLESLGYLQ